MPHHRPASVGLLLAPLPEVHIVPPDITIAIRPGRAMSSNTTPHTIQPTTVPLGSVSPYSRKFQPSEPKRIVHIGTSRLGAMMLIAAKVPANVARIITGIAT